MHLRLSCAPETYKIIRCDTQRLFKHIFTPMVLGPRRQLEIHISFSQHTSSQLSFEIRCSSQNLMDLFIEDNIDNWIVDCRALREAGRYSCHSQVEWLPTVIHNPKGKGGVRQPAHQEAHHHEDHHPGHLPLCFLG